MSKNNAKKSPISPFVNRNSTRWNDELAYMPQIPKNQEDKRNQLFNSMGFQTTMKVFKSTKHKPLIKKLIQFFTSPCAQLVVLGHVSWFPYGPD